MPAETAWAGKYIEVKQAGPWEFVSRTRGVTAAVILAIDDGHVILVEQYRVPLGRLCLELPAGLVGDEADGEAVVPAAMRELEEETGYRAGRMADLGRFHASPGMSSEGFTLLRAEDLAKVGEGGGVAGEDIRVYRVAMAEIPAFIEAKRAEGVAIDVKLLLLLGPAFLGRSTSPA
ncbi:NUDIX hydrolase [Sphingosinicella rhizophila]|uniref:GDP-mannose pyrophosphatase n=1 Tax=Sphingosinicella rhizophila TaxID=3050082 RepID=A0ABU3QC68_9SPHN|nr:NUDIX hydrolase [Sphingosinicella sp. GR2756]MDT9600984.1 NUDIX hydrolase [Sphingosinicella sp. GR2756]